ncbi:HNH endonuclease [Georgenia sp. EYE_87]|uniref:HNH endonuclease signature motif containing protein n=1 Tax=Georgenia sp. EYE_87 TaxID=2853448 RepID=UPI00249E1238|nr:HNH endonuclease signature motif containing protein [Georgenia sp. EYE_87]MCK6210010.1 HNH endonuclease [Georgenia sp. EYE_87]
MFEDEIDGAGGDPVVGAAGVLVSEVERVYARVLADWAAAGEVTTVVVGDGASRFELYPPARRRTVLPVPGGTVRPVVGADASPDPDTPAATDDSAVPGALAVPGGPAESVPWWAAVPTGAAPVPAAAPPGPGDPALGVALGRGLVDGEADAAGATVLEALPGGAPLAVLLAPLVPGELGAATLVETIAGYERIASWAIARQAEHVRELTDRQGASSKAAEQAAAEIGARLGSTPAVGSAKVNLAAALDTYPEVADALATGRIDTRKANILATTEPGLSVREHRRVVTGLLKDADRVPGPRLRRRIRAAALSVNPDAGRERRKKEHAARQVTLTPAPDGMAWITAFLRADAARTVKVALDALAEAAVADTDPGQDPRTRDQVRADAFVDLFTAVLDRGVDLAGHPLPTGTPARAGAQITVGAGTLLGLDEAAGYLAGYGPIPAELAREIAQDATWRALFTDRDGHFAGLSTRAYRPGAELSRTVRARDVTCTFPGCTRPSIVCDLDHRIAYDPAIAHLVKQTSACNLHPLCRRHHNLKTTRRWHVRRERDGTLLWIPARTRHRYRHTPDPPAGTPAAVDPWATINATTGTDPPY